MILSVVVLLLLYMAIVVSTVDHHPGRVYASTSYFDDQNCTTLIGVGGWTAAHKTVISCAQTSASTNLYVTPQRCASIAPCDSNAAGAPEIYRFQTMC